MKKFIISAMITAAAIAYSFAGADEVGKVFSVYPDKREVIITIQADEKLNIGDRLQVETGGKKFILEVTFPMLTTSKCIFKGKGKLPQLNKGMSVYRYRKDEPADKPIVNPSGELTKGIYLRKIPDTNMQIAIIGDNMTATITNLDMNISEIDGANKAMEEPQYKGKYSIDGDIITITAVDKYNDETVYKGKFTKDSLYMTCYKHMGALRNDPYYTYQFIR